MAPPEGVAPGQATRGWSGSGQATRGWSGSGQVTRGWSGLGQATAGLGQATAGSGQATAGSGQATAGLGQATAGSGQATRGWSGSGQVTPDPPTQEGSDTVLVAGAGASHGQAGPRAASGCARDMVEISGDYCPAVVQICDRWIEEERDRCERYRTMVKCLGKTRAHHFCIDRYEFPNEPGTNPTVAVTWEQSEAYCRAGGKRLCTDEEWTLACEGPERRPYPYGFVRDATSCNVDKPYIQHTDDAYKNPKTRPSEVSRLSQIESSGARQKCVSPFGVYDMTGNVDEWVSNPHGSPAGPEFDSGLKGGYWGQVRNRCRPMTTDHSRGHSGYQIGFRCCAEIRETESAIDEPAVESRVPLVSFDLTGAVASALPDGTGPTLGRFGVSSPTERSGIVGARSQDVLLAPSPPAAGEECESRGCRELQPGELPSRPDEDDDSEDATERVGG